MQVTLLLHLQTAVSALSLDIASEWGSSTAPLSLISPLRIRLVHGRLGAAPTSLPSVSEGLQKVAIYPVLQCREAGAGRYAREARKRLGIRRLVQNQLCDA